MEWTARMVCGFDGTAINPGFNSCQACGAVYRKQAGCIGNLFAILGFVIVAAGVIIMVQVHYGWLLGLLFVAAGGVVVWVAHKLAPHKWVRPAISVKVR